MILWIASWPHCGSTLMRAFLQDVFGMKCYSRYREYELEFLFGADSVKFSKQWSPALYEKTLLGQDLIALKTHEFPFDNCSAIYVVRDGLDACASLARYWKMSIQDIILGLNAADNKTFGTWATSYQAWYPPNHANRIIVHFDDILHKPELVANQVTSLLSIKPTGSFVNRYQECHNHDARLFSGNGKNHDIYEHNDLELFWRINGAVMKELGYIDEVPSLLRLPDSQQLPRSVTVEDTIGGHHRCSSRTNAEIEHYTRMKNETTGTEDSKVTAD